MAEFNKGYYRRQGRVEGIHLEHERIIKLLQSKRCFCLDLPDDQTFADKEELMKHMNCDWKAMMIEYHVELINGEAE